jgi:antitoxin VapB
MVDNQPWLLPPSSISRTPKPAEELAELTGESITEAVTEALRQRLERERQSRSRTGMADRLMAIGRCAASLPILDPRTPDEMLYDEDGLPK